MIPIEKCIETINQFDESPEKTERVLRKASKNIPFPNNIPNTKILSTAQFYSQTLFERKGFIPQRGDFGFYLATEERKPLALVSFSISEDKYFEIKQFQGNKPKNLQDRERTIIAYLPWESALASVVEETAKRCDVNGTRIPSHGFFPNNTGKRLAIRYDITALERGYCPEKPNVYVLNFNQSQQSS